MFKQLKLYVNLNLMIQCLRFILNFNNFIHFNWQIMNKDEQITFTFFEKLNIKD
jgi:hypothetical protein